MSPTHSIEPTLSPKPTMSERPTPTPTVMFAPTMLPTPTPTDALWRSHWEVTSGDCEVVGPCLYSHLPFTPLGSSPYQFYTSGDHCTARPSYDGVLSVQFRTYSTAYASCLGDWLSFDHSGFGGDVNGVRYCTRNTGGYEYVQAYNTITNEDVTDSAPSLDGYEITAMHSIYWYTNSFGISLGFEICISDDPLHPTPAPTLSPKPSTTFAPTGGAPTALPVPAPTMMGLTLTSGDCEVMGLCFTTPCYGGGEGGVCPGDGTYGDNQDCQITVNEDATLIERTSFELWYSADCTNDYLQVGNTKYCGTTGPEGANGPRATSSSS